MSRHVGRPASTGHCMSAFTAEPVDRALSSTVVCCRNWLYWIKAPPVAARVSTGRVVVAWPWERATTLRAALRAVLGRGPLPRLPSPVDAPLQLTRNQEMRNRRSPLGRPTGWVRTAQRCGSRGPACHPADLPRGLPRRVKGAASHASVGTPRKCPLDTAR